MNAPSEDDHNPIPAAKDAEASAHSVQSAASCAASIKIEESPVPPRCFFDASLLFYSMELLQIDRSELAKRDPLLFYELQGRCALCRSKEECVQDQTQEFDDARWDRWIEYCPNSIVLTTLGAAENCPLAAQHFKMTRDSWRENIDDTISRCPSGSARADRTDGDADPGVCG
jgi:hypothetical protein